MTLSTGALFAIGLFAALWLLAGLWAIGRGVAMQRRSAGALSPSHAATR